MTRKRTPSDYALWAALPMAHTSKIEGRITMILDTTRRRTTPRRALIFSIAIGAAALIPLAMLKPTAKAQTPSPVVSQTATAASPNAAMKRLHRIYGLLQTYRRTHDGAFPSMFGGTDSILTDMAVHPQQYGLPDVGVSGGKQGGALFSLPGTTQIVYFLHDKRPDGTPVGTAKRAGTRDMFAYTGLYVSNHPHGATGFYLVLWDDGTVSKVPAGSALSVPSYDVIGPAGAAQEAARQGLKQIAFPGEAGLPQH